MRRLIIFATVAVLGFTPLGLRAVSAQWVDYGWQGVTVEGPVSRGDQDADVPFELLDAFLGNAAESQVAATPSVVEENQVGNGASIVDRLDEVYSVIFADPDGDNRAYIPEVYGAEFMVV